MIVGATSHTIPTSQCNAVQSAVNAKLRELKGRCSIRPTLRWLDQRIASLIHGGVTETSADPNSRAEADEAEVPPTALSSTWSIEQQKAFETALRRFPSAQNKHERWSKIADAVPGPCDANAFTLLHRETPPWTFFTHPFHRQDEA